MWVYFPSFYVFNCYISVQWLSKSLPKCPPESWDLRVCVALQVQDGAWSKAGHTDACGPVWQRQCPRLHIAHRWFSWATFTVESICLNYMHKIYFLEQFLVHSKIERKVQGVPIYPLTLHMHSPPPHYQHPPAFVTTDEPTLTHHYHPEPTVYIRVPLCVIHFIGLEQMYSGLCLPQCRTGQFHRPQVLRSTPSSLPSNSWQPLTDVLSP